MPRARKRTAPVDEGDDDTPPSRASAPRPYQPGARSCEGCHQRKVRCDRGVPCINCSRYGMTCVYPTRELDGAQKGPTLRDINNRLKRMEVLLSRLSESREAVDNYAGHDESDIQAQSRPSQNVKEIETARQGPSDRPPNKSTWEILLNNSDIEPLLQDESIGLETAPSHPRLNRVGNQTIPTQPGASALESDFELLDFYPDTQLALRLWDIYVKSVDPVVKILHIPTVQSTVLATLLDPRSAHRSTVVLTFSIYYAAVTALYYSDDENVDLGCGKPVLLKRYQTVLDRLLVTPDLMSGPDITGLQALAIYVTCLRAHELGRRVWVLTGLAIRLAQSIDLHRDGASLKLSPFETEMRLRLWWHLCVLDSRAPEDQGFQPTVDLANQELRLPLNVNDDRLYPDMTNLAVESNGWTEMAFFLIQTKSCRVIHPILDTQHQHPADPLLDIREKRKMIQDPAKYLLDSYGISASSSGLTDPLPRIATQHVETACQKMEFVLQLREEIYMRKQNETENADATPDVFKLSFKLACDALEASHALLKGGFAGRFKWFLNMYTQWYALAYVLRSLCSSPRGFNADSAWTLVEELLPTEEVHDEHGHGRIWRVLRLLRNEAWSLRQDGKLSSSGRDPSSQHFPHAEMVDTTAVDEGTPIPHDWASDFIVDPDKSIFSSLDLLMPEIPFLPDWNAVINGQ